MNSILKKILLWLIVLTAWELLAPLVPGNIIPPISQVLQEFGNQQTLLKLVVDSWTTLSVLTPAIGIGWLVAYMTFAILEPVRDWSYQVYNMLRYVPLPAIIPVTILCFGLGFGAQIGLVAFGSWVLTTGFLFALYETEYRQFAHTHNGWRIGYFQRLKVLCNLSWHRSYQLWPSLIVWSLGNIILAEIVIGGSFGLGIRMVESQQLFNAPRLWLYLVITAVLAITLERLLHWSSSFVKWNILRTSSTVVLIAALIGSVFSLYRTVQPKNGFVISTYNASINLPLWVMQEKFNDQDYELESVPSGLVGLQNWQAGRVDAVGYVDMPNILAGSKKDTLIISQAVETPKEPLLYILTQKNTLVDLQGEVGYYPSNVLVKAGLDFALFKEGVRTSQLTYQTSGDPNSLVQAFILGKLSAVLLPEPFATQIEKRGNILRVNANKSLIQGVSFDQLPLAGMIVDPKISNEKQKKLMQNVDQSIDFIRAHSKDGKADTELSEIMNKAELHPESKIPVFTKSNEYKIEETKTLLNALKIYDSSIQIETSSIENLYPRK
jgi:ABC-type nitrate/sulfonate/bicarbonate transport system permease component/ABC-type nitrate/sulfonate/bicarbonate transport system substrate-binding protein